MKLRIEAVECHNGCTPFRHSFRHNSAVRARAQSLFVRVTDESGKSGIGEGCPRYYVTGETLDSAAGFVASIQDEVRTLNCIDDLKRFIYTHSNLIDTNPAAWCAVELAVLDLIAKVEQVTVEELLGQMSRRSVYQYTAVLGHSDPHTFKTLFEKYRALGLVDFKVKLSGHPDLDNEKFDVMRPHQHAITIRADANNLWSHVSDAVNYLATINRQISSIEEPLVARDIDGLERLHGNTGIDIILDESLSRISQVPDLGRHPEIWTANIRVSKMGGLIRSLRMIRRLRNAGIAITIGAHVGESSLLTRAALVLADAAGPALVAQEGAFGEYLLQSDPMDTLIQFGKGGRLDSHSMDWRSSPGFGLSLKE
jgi:L-alanine-DL-glutamate epimerase-like enolase superfamily enzyme